MNSLRSRLPRPDKAHIFKFNTKRTKRCWRCLLILDDNGQPRIFRHDATSPVFAYRGVARKIAAHKKGFGIYRGRQLISTI